MITVSEKQAMIEDFERLILVSPEQIITAVSYTHLDVYKRQARTCLGISWQRRRKEVRKNEIIRIV